MTDEVTAVIRVVELRSTKKLVDQINNMALDQDLLFSNVVQNKKKKFSRRLEVGKEEPGV
jgi:hypothetical protein